MNADVGTSRVRIVVLVPARNEARVIGRKLRNLAWCSWPDGDDHLSCVVDDGSYDGTGELAERERAGFSGVALEVFRNEGRAGKAAAVGAALASLEARGERFDVVLLSDADVLLARDALVRCVDRLCADERIGVVCGAQVFVRDLGGGPAPRSADGSAPVPAGELYDRWTACVRRFESRWGRLFSLHGQLCAWRAGLGLEPPAGLAADDLELAFRAHRQGLRVELVAGARFFEEKARGRDQAVQAQRRAQAYFQVMRDRDWPLGRGLIDRLQWLLYRGLPPAAPYLLAASVVGTLVLASFLGGAPLVWVVGVLWGVLGSTGPGRTLVRRLLVIAKAQRARLELSDRWDTLRSRAGTSEGT